MNMFNVNNKDNTTAIIDVVCCHYCKDWTDIRDCSSVSIAYTGMLQIAGLIKNRYIDSD